MTETSTELALRAPSMPSARDMDAAALYAERLAQSGLLPSAYRRNPANVLYAIEYGRMIGLTPMAAITGVHVIEGKPTASAALISALVRRAGHKLRVKGDARGAVAQIIRSDDPEFVFEASFTIQDAQRAGLAQKGVWQHYPGAMCKARAISQVARDACEEALFGMHYTPEELGVDVDEEGVPVKSVLDAVERKAHRECRTEPPKDDEWTTPQGEAAAVDQTPRPSTHGQRTKLVLLVKDKRGVLDDAGRRRILGELAGREIASSKELSFAEAHRAIDALSAEKDHIPDAEIVPEPPAPNPRNGDIAVSRGVEAALATPDAEAARALLEESDKLAADWLVEINGAAGHGELESIGRRISAAVQDGRLLDADRKDLDTAWRDRKSQLPPVEQPEGDEPGSDSWSHRMLAERTGVSA